MSQKPLSVSEIDDLMAIFRGGRKQGGHLGSVESVDLTNTSRIPKGIFETLAVRHEQATRTMVQNVRTILRTDLSIDLTRLVQDSFGSFKEGLKDPCCVFVFEMPPLRQPAYLVVDHGFAYASLDRLLGGPGKSEGEGRELTSTEVAILGEVIQPIVAAHATVWQRFVNVQPRFQKLVTVPRFLRDVRGSDPILVANYAMRGFAEGTCFHFAMPLAGIEAHLQGSRKDAPDTSAAKTSQDRARMSAQMAGLDVGVSVCLGSASLPVRDLLGLVPGDVVVLDRAVDEPLEFTVEGKPKHLGFLMRQHRSLVFKVAKKPGT